MAPDILEPDAIYSAARVHTLVVVDVVLLAFAAASGHEHHRRPDDASRDVAWIPAETDSDAEPEAMAVTAGVPSTSDSDGAELSGWRSAPVHPLARIIRQPQPAQARRGSTNGASVLTARQVQQVRDAAAIGFPQRAIAAHFGLSQSTVSDIVAGRAWAHLPQEPRSPLRPVTGADADHLPTLPSTPRRTR